MYVCHIEIGVLMGYFFKPPDNDLGIRSETVSSQKTVISTMMAGFKVYRKSRERRQDYLRLRITILKN